MPFNILIDLGKLKTLYSGLGQFSYYYGKNLIRIHDGLIQWNFLTPVSYNNKFGTRVRYEFLSFKRRYFPSLCNEYDIWHAIHQDSAYWPGHKNTKYILTIHDLNFLREKGSFRIKKRLQNLQRKVNRASYITFISNFTAAEVSKHLDLGNKPVKVIHNGVEIDTGKSVPRPVYLPAGRYLFALGMVLEKKNFHVLVEFIRKMEGYNLIIAGDKSFSYGRKLEREIHRKKLSNRIIMPGIISQDEKIYLYRNCDAFLFPSLNEGFGLPVIEAMRFGKPVFISRFSSLPEIGGELAFYWDSFNAGDMTQLFNEKMDYFNRHKSELSERITNYSHLFSWEKSIDAYTDIYRELLTPAKPQTVVNRPVPVEGISDRQPVKVLHLSSEKDWRGGEQQIAYLVEELNKMGVHNMVVCEKESRVEELCKKNNWDFHSSGFSSSLNLGTARKVATLCRKNEIDILHLHTSKSHTVGVLSTLFGHTSRLILTRRVDNPIGTNFLSRWKYNHNRIKRILTVSDKIKEVVTSVLKQSSKCITIHSGIDKSRFDATETRSRKILREMVHAGSDDVLVGNTSALAKHKDYYTFIDTAEWVIEQGLPAKFVIIGEGPEEKNIRHYISKKNLDSHVILTGFRKDISLLLPELDIFLMTSRTEGLGTSILDAFAARIPVVATRAGGIPEMVLSGKTGLLADPGDYVTLGKHILSVASDPELRNQLIRNALDLLESGFTKEIMAKKVLLVYHEILQ